MKKYGLLILGVLCVLAACGTKDVPAGEAAEKEGSRIEGLTPLNIELSADYHGEWEDGKALLRSECSTVHVLDDGYGELKQAFKEYNEKNCEEVKKIYDENLEWVMAPEGKGELPDDMELYIERKIQVVRADDRVVSFWNRETGYLGGAHGFFYEGTANFDSKTGKQLSLSDIAADYDGLYKLVAQMLSDSYEKELFFENYEEAILHPMFYGGLDEGTTPLEWTLDGEGVYFSFSPYVLAPWAAGTLFVKVPFEGHEELFIEKYRQVPAHPIKNVGEGQQFRVDTDGDGIAEAVWFLCDHNQEEYGGRLFICLAPEGEKEEPLRTDCGGYYGCFENAWVLETALGHPYLYVEFASDNDYRNLEIYNLAAKGETSFSHVGGSGDSVYSHFIGDSGQFTLYTRIHYLGSYYGYRAYSIGEDGLPVPKEEIYEIAQGPSSYGNSITSKRELSVTVYENGVEKEMVLPAGTVFYLERTDGASFMEAKLEDGRLCRIHTEGSQESGGLFIDGIREDDCFADLHYAG